LHLLLHAGLSPNRALAGLYAGKYARYKMLLDTMAPVWPRLTWRAPA